MGVNVFLNVYDMTKLNYVLGCLKMSVYHTGVQVYDREYRFDKHDDFYTGVVCQSKPKCLEGMSFRHSIFLGETQLNAREIELALTELSYEFPGNSYDLFSNNCNHFSNALSLRLVGKEIPSQIFNASKRLSFARCLLPERLLTSSKNNTTDSFSKKKDSLVLGKKRMQNKRTQDIELVLLDNNYMNSSSSCADLSINTSN